MQRVTGALLATVPKAASKKSVFVKRAQRVTAIALFGVGAVVCICGPEAGEVIASAAQGRPLCIPWTALTAQGNKQSKEQTASFRIYNLSLHTIRLEAQADCSCTGLSWNRTTLQPLRFCTLAASFFTPQNGDGKKTVRVQVRSNQPQMPSQWLMVNINERIQE